MGTAVYGGSPRHNAPRRISVGSAVIGGSIASHLGHSSPSLHQQHHQHYPPLNKQHHQSATMFTVQSAAGSAALLMNHSASTIIFPPPTSFVSATMPVASTMATATAGGHLGSSIGGHHHQQQQQQQLHHHQHHSQQTSPHYAHSHNQQQQMYHHRHSKRKSAVELLAESKPFYVKSETVLDRQQHQLFYANRQSANGAGNPQSPSCAMSPSRTPMSHHMRNASNASSGGGGGPSLGAFSTLSAARRSVSSSSDLLQTKLRSLLNQASLDHGAGGADATTATAASPSSVATATHGGGKPGKSDKVYEHHMHYASPKKLSQELSVHPDQNSDLSVFFPSAFLSPQSLPPHPAVTDDDIFSYGIDEPLVSDFQTISPPAEYAEDVTTPSASSLKHPQHHQHGHSGGRSFSNRYSGYQRSFSHSPSAACIAAGSPNDDHSPHYHHSSTNASNQTSSAATAASNNASGFNINSHKSLPDLHAQISRHSPHSEALSCCSRGARSNKSGSSFNRDSGGSSGHYTHRSEPNSSGVAVVCGPIGGPSGKYANKQQQQQQPHQQQLMMGTDPSGHGGGAVDFRRDSGSSTQHSGNSYYAYGIPPLRYDCMECRTNKMPIVQQSSIEDAQGLLEFTTPEVPEAFQDDYQQQQQPQSAQQMMLMMVGKPPSSSAAAAARHSRDKDPSRMHHHQQHQHAAARFAGAAYPEDCGGGDHASAPALVHGHGQGPSSQLQLQEQFGYYTSGGGGKESTGRSATTGERGPLEAELSPPLGTFKRQRCFRVKQRDRYSSPSDRNSRCGGTDDTAERRPILRSKSDVSDRHWHRGGHPQQTSSGGAGGCVSPPMISGSKSADGQHTTRSYSSGSGGGGSSSCGSGGGPQSARSEVMSQLERFFDRLGLQEDVYEACIAPKGLRRFGGGGGGGGSSGRESDESDHSSPVFFSDASTVDSTRLPDSTETTVVAAPIMTQQQQQMYRPSEPPSIVERNARIIKWLCACRKSQMA